MNDFVGILIWGVAAGIVAFVVAHHNVRGNSRIRLTRWCLSIGALALCFFGVNVLFALKIIPARGALGLGFVGLPALVLGVLLSAADALGKRRQGDN